MTTNEEISRAVLDAIQRDIDDHGKAEIRQAELDAIRTLAARDGVAEKPIERDELMDRTYIPLPGGWEVQTKGKGSTFRICAPQGERLPIPDSPYLHETLERMAREVHAACAAHPAQPAGKVRVTEAMVEAAGLDAADLRDLAGALTVVGVSPFMAGERVTKEQAEYTMELCRSVTAQASVVLNSIAGAVIHQPITTGVEVEKLARWLFWNDHGGLNDGPHWDDCEQTRNYYRELAGGALAAARQEDEK